MQRYQQIVLCVAPLIGAVLVYTSLITTTQSELDLKLNELDSVKQQYQILEIKLRQKQKLKTKQQLIHREINRLRNSVPDKPDLDLLMIDLSKICNTNEVTLLGVETFDPRKQAKKNKQGLIASLVQEVGGKMPGTKDKKKKQRRKPRNKKNVTEAEEDPLGLKHETKRVFITGDFKGLVGVLNSLEKYQRIVGIRDLIIALPDDDDREFVKTIASERGKDLELNSPVMTFLLHVYYLPS